jgi:dihydropteroate synthase
MFIRRILSDLFEDYVHELQSIGAAYDKAQLADRINPFLTLKIFDLSPDEYHHFVKSLKNNRILGWYSQSDSKMAIIASFPNWEAVKDILQVSQLKLPHYWEDFVNFRYGWTKRSWNYLPRNKKVVKNSPLLMGILNVTPDSFSDGGKFYQPEIAFRHAMEMEAAGADIIDIGAESTRPGAQAVDLKEEWSRLQPVFQKLQKHIKIPISIDTYKSEIASRAMAEGAEIVNDISGLSFDKKMAEVVAKKECPVIMMHIKGTPRNMQKNPSYENLMEELFTFFIKRIEYAKKSGVRKIILDPGIGFGKRYEDNFEIIRRLAEFRTLGFPLLVGPSRKSFIGKTLDIEVEDRLMGTAAAVALTIQNGADIVRVHDIREMKQVAQISQAIKSKKNF